MRTWGLLAGLALTTAGDLGLGQCQRDARAVLLSAPIAGQSLSYSRGQNVSPAYEGWEAGRRRHEVLRVRLHEPQLGRRDRRAGRRPTTASTSAIADQGQPTHFLPRRNRFVFRVPVPKGFSEKDELIWTLTTQGKTEKAYATLRLDYQIDDVVRASETGALGAGSSSPEIRANKPPTVEVQGRKALTAKVGEAVTLIVEVTDDGVPKRRGSGLAGAAVANTGSRRDTAADTPADSQAPVRVNRAWMPPARVTVGKNVGLHVSWFVYRGKGSVTFTPEQVMSWEDTRAGANSPWAPIWVPPPMPAERPGVGAGHVLGTGRLRAARARRRWRADRRRPRHRHRDP